MQVPRILPVVLTLGLGLSTLLATARSAGAQCVDDPPTGSILVRACGDVAQRTDLQEQASTPRFDFDLFARFPIVVAPTGWLPRLEVRIPQSFWGVAVRERQGATGRLSARVARLAGR